MEEDDESVTSTGTLIINEDFTDTIRDLRLRNRELRRLDPSVSRMNTHSSFFDEYMRNLRTIHAYERPQQPSLYERARRLVSSLTGENPRINPR